MASSNLLSYAWGVAKLPGSLAYLTLCLLNKKESIGTVLQRLGWSSIERRSGPVLWFNVNGPGETSTFLPLVHKCLQEYNEKVTVLVTTPCLEVYKLLWEALPRRVLVQLVPLENPITIAAFLRKWQPQVGVFLDTPFHRDLTLMARDSGVRLALLNAQMPGDEMLVWHARHTSREVLKQTLSLYSLIVPRTYVDVGRFRMFGATLGQMPGWSTDLQQASELGACASRLLNQRPKLRRSLLKRLGGRQLWIAANTLPDEDPVVARIHAAVRSRHKGLLTLVAPRVQSTTTGKGNLDESRNKSVYTASVRRLSAERRLQVDLLSTVVEDPERLSPDLDVLVLDDPEALIALYSLSEIVLVGGSLLPSLDGASSPAAAAVAGCALLMGPHGAEFLGMASDLNNAAIMASEEVSIAVAQTGPNLSGIRPGDLETPREAEGQAPGLPRTPSVSPWFAGPRSGPASRAGVASLVDNSSAPGSHERHWQWFEDVQGPGTGRLMSAPPTAPEQFNLRPFTQPYVVSPFRGPFTGSTSQGDSTGSRNIFIAPLSSPGVTYSRGEARSPPETFAPATTGTDMGSTYRQKRAIDRFRWMTGRDVSGFGYTSELDPENSDSTSSDSDEDGERPEAGDGTGVRRVEKQDASLHVSAATDATSCRVQDPTPCEAGLKKSSDGSVSEKGAATSVLPQPLSPVSPRGAAGVSTPFIASAPSMEIGVGDQPATAPLVAVGHDESTAADYDDGEFHDAIEAVDDDMAIGQLAAVPWHEGAVPGDGIEASQVPLAAKSSSRAAGAKLDGLEAQGVLTPLGNCHQVSTYVGTEQVQEAVETVHNISGGAAKAKEQAGTGRGTDTVNRAMLQGEVLDKVIAEGKAGALDSDRVEPCIENLEDKCSPAPLPGTGELPEQDGHLLLRRKLRSWKQLVAKPCGDTGWLFPCMASRGYRLAVQGGGDGTSTTKSASPCHSMDIAICRAADLSDDEDEDWVPRHALGEARHMVSDPGLPSPVSKTTGERRFFSLEWPAPSAKSLIDPAHFGLVQADSSNSTIDLQMPLHSEPGQSLKSTNSAPGPDKRHFLRVLEALDEMASMETWNSDVSMAAMVERNEGSSGEYTPLSVHSPPSATAVTCETSRIFPDSPLASFRGSLDHYLQNLSGSSLPNTVRGRTGRGAMARMSGRSTFEPEGSDELAGLSAPAKVENKGDAFGANHVDAGQDDVLSPGYLIVNDVALLPVPHGLVTELDSSISAAGEAADDTGSSELSPTVVSAALICDAVSPDEELISPTAIAPASGVSTDETLAASSRPVSGGRRGNIDPHAPCAAESPKSDFEFGGSVPDDTGSGSPTLLATTSVHNGSGANLQACMATDNTTETESQQPETIHPLAGTAQVGFARPSSRTSSPSSNNSWSDPPVVASPPHLVAPAAAVAARFHSSRQQTDLSQSTSGNRGDINPYNAGTCFAGQACFKWCIDGNTSPAMMPAVTRSRSASPLGSGAEVGGVSAAEASSSGLSATRGPLASSSMSVSSISSRGSTDLPSFHQVASIGSWLDHFGSMLPQPSLRLQCSQAQHDPMVWFSQQMVQRDASGGAPVSAAALEGVAPGLRAPMHSPLRAFDDNVYPGINPKALASVTTTLFPAADAASSYPSPLSLPVASPWVQPRAAGGPTVATSSSPFRSTSADQVTTFISGRSQYSTAALPNVTMSSVFALPHCSSEAGIQGGTAANPGGATRRTTRDELSVLLNSPRSPVSPVRVARIVSAGVDRWAQSVSQLILPVGAPAVGSITLPMSPAEARNANSLSSPRQQHHMHASNPGPSVVDSADGEARPLRLAPPSINMQQQELNGRPSAQIQGLSPSSSPMGAAYLVACGASSVAAAPRQQQPDSSFPSNSSSCPNTPSSPFREPGEALHHSTAHQLRSPSLPSSLILSPCRDDSRSFEESFEAAVRATPMKSPGRSNASQKSQYTSPYSSAYVATTALCPIPNPEMGFRSLFLEEEEENLAADQGCDGEEDPMPLSPRANSQNVLFCMHIKKDDDSVENAVFAAANDPAVHDLSTRLGTVNPPVPLWPAPPLLPTASGVDAAAPPIFVQGLPPARRRWPSNGSSSGAVPTAISPFAVLGLGDTNPPPPAVASIQGTGAPDVLPTIPPIISSVAHSGSNEMSATLTGSAAASAETFDAEHSASFACATFDSLPTLTCIASLPDTDDDDGSASASPARTYPHLGEAGRQPRITLSGGLLVVPAVTSSGSAHLPKSNLSHSSNPRQETEELAEEPSMGLPTVYESTAAASHQAPQQASQSASSSGNSRSVISCSTLNGNGGIGSSSSNIADHGSAGSLGLASLAAAGRDESPPRSPAERTSCPRSSCPSASPVRPPLYSAQSSPVPRGPRLPCMPALSSQMLDGRYLPQSPSSPRMLSPRARTSTPAASGPFSPPASYMSPRATDPRVSPRKVFTAMKRTPRDMPPRAAADAFRLSQFPSPSSSSTAAERFASPSTGISTAGLVESIFGDSTVSSVPDRCSAALVSSFTTKFANVASASPDVSASQFPAASPRHRTSWQMARQPGLAGGSVGGGINSDDEPLLSTRASCPAGFAAMSDGGLLPSTHSGRRDEPFSPPCGPSEQSHVLHAQRSQQQQMWDRARAESRNASAAGTPRSARALFVPSPLPILPSACGSMEFSALAVEAPRSPRVATSPAPAFTLDTSIIGTVDTASSTRDIFEEELWQLRQARSTYQSMSGQGTALSAQVVPPASPRAGADAPGQGALPVEPPSPSWSQVSRRLFPDVSSGRVTAATVSTAATSALQRRSVDQLDEVLAHMKVQVASPVSPQPRLPPPPVSPRPMTGTAGASAHCSSLRSSSSLWQTTLLQPARKSAPGDQNSQRFSPQRNAPGNPAAAGGNGAPSALRSSPNAAVHPHWAQHLRGLHSSSDGGLGGSHLLSVPLLPHLPPLPPLPLLGHVPNLPGEPGPSLASWPSLSLETGIGGTDYAGFDVSAEVLRRRMLRQSAPELSLEHELLGGSRGTKAASTTLHGMPAVAEEEALVALESQFEAAEQEAADLPIETRVATPTALSQASTANFAMAGNDAATVGLLGNLTPYPSGAAQPGRASLVSQVVLPSPRAATERFAPSRAVTVQDLGSGGSRGAGRDTSGSMHSHPEMKRQPRALLTTEATAARGPASSGGAAGYCNARAVQSQADAAGMGLKPLEDGVMDFTVPIHKPRASSFGGDTAADGSSHYHQESINNRQHVPRAAVARPVGLHQSAHMEDSGPSIHAQGSMTVGRVNPAGNRASPVGSKGGDRSPEQEQPIAPCSRYMGQYLLPASKVTTDPRVGPAVWIVSNEDELAAALSRLLHDTVERQSRGRAAAQGSAKLASSLVAAVWGVLEDMVIGPALQAYIASRNARAAT